MTSRRCCSRSSSLEASTAALWRVGAEMMVGCCSADAAESFHHLGSFRVAMVSCSGSSKMRTRRSSSRSFSSRRWGCWRLNEVVHGWLLVEGGSMYVVFNFEGYWLRIGRCGLDQTRRRRRARRGDLWRARRATWDWSWSTPFYTQLVQGLKVLHTDFCDDWLKTLRSRVVFIGVLGGGDRRRGWSTPRGVGGSWRLKRRWNVVVHVLVHLSVAADGAESRSSRSRALQRLSTSAVVVLLCWRRGSTWRSVGGSWASASRLKRVEDVLVDSCARNHGPRGPRWCVRRCWSPRTWK